MSYIIDGISEERVVLVLPKPKDTGKDTNEEWVVTI